MHWYDQVFYAVSSLILLSLPFCVGWGCIWWGRKGRDYSGWRWMVSKTGVVYSAMILGMIAAFVVMGPKNSATAAEFPYTYRWAPKIFWAAVIGLVFPVFGRGWVRLANAICALDGCLFAMVAFAWL